MNHVEVVDSVLITSRPSKIVSRDIQKQFNIAKMGNLSNIQKVQILRNLDLDPSIIDSIDEYLSPALIERPFALMIAADRLRDQKSVQTVSNEDTKLSVMDVCDEYELEFDAREETKRVDDISTKFKHEMKNCFMIWLIIKLSVYSEMIIAKNHSFRFIQNYIMRMQ